MDYIICTELYISTTYRLNIQSYINHIIILNMYTFICLWLLETKFHTCKLSFIEPWFWDSAVTIAEEAVMSKAAEQARSLFGICLSHRPKWQQFLICSSGFFFGYLVNGICEVLYRVYTYVHVLINWLIFFNIIWWFESVKPL